MFNNAEGSASMPLAPRTKHDHGPFGATGSAAAKRVPARPHRSACYWQSARFLGPNGDAIHAPSPQFVIHESRFEAASDTRRTLEPV